MRIFVVDDQRLSRASIIEMVEWESKGLTFAGEFANGQEAYEAILQEQPDIVITDVRMPLIDGLQLAELIGEHQLDVSFIIVSGFDEYEYVRKSIQLDVFDYILKPVDKDELNQAIDIVIKKRLEIQVQKSITLAKMRENFFYSYLESLVDPDKNIEEGLAEIQFGTSNNVFATVLFDKMSGDLQDWLHDAFPHEQIIILKYRGMHLLIISGDHLNKRELLSTIHKANELFECGQKCIGPLSHGINELPGSVKSTFNTVMIQPSLPHDQRKQVATFEQVEQLTLSKLNFNRDLESKWLLTIHRRNWQEAQRMLHCILDLFIENNHPNPLLIDGFFSYILLKGINKLYENQIIDEQQFLSACEITKIIPLYRDPIQKKQTIVSFFESAFTASPSLTRNKINQSIQNAKKYVDEHYLEDISLIDLAAKYYVSPGYFSSMFKHFVGMNFIDYITKLRMKYASQLLINNTELKVYEIAKLCGYQDVKYFRQQFKRFFDQTPQEFKEEHRCLTI